MASLHPTTSVQSHEELIGEYAKVIETERNRGDEAERTYEALKRVHEDTIEEFRVSQDQTQKLFSETEFKLKRSDDTVRDLRQTILDQARQIADLQSNLLTPQKHELFRIQAQAEADKAYQSKQRSLQDEIVTLKSRVAALTQENTALRADSDLREADFKRQKNDLVARYERRLDDAKREKDAAVLVIPAVDAGKFRQLQRDNDQLELRVKAQDMELESVRADKAKADEEYERTNKGNMRKIVERDLLIENLKTELEVTKTQVDHLRKQVSDINTESLQSLQKILNLESEKESLQSDIDGINHKHQVELGSVRAKSAMEKAQLQKEINTLKAEIENLKNDSADLRKALDLQKQLIADKEHEAQMKLNHQAQREVAELSRLEQQRSHLEQKLSAAEKQSADLERELQSKSDQILDERKVAALGLSESVKESDALKLRIMEYQRMEITFAKTKSDYAVLQQEIKGLLQQITTAEETLRNLNLEKGQLEKQLVELSEREKNQQIAFKDSLSQHELEKQAILNTFNEKRSSYGTRIKEQEAKLQENDKQILLVNEKLKDADRKYQMYKKRTKVIVAELVAAVKAKAALVEMHKDSVSAATYQKALDEIVHLKKLLIRLRGIVLPGNVANKTLNLELNQIMPTEATTSGKSVGELFDEQLRRKTALPKRPSEDVELRSLFDRLKPLGFDENSLIRDADSEQFSSPASSPPRLRDLT